MNSNREFMKRSRLMNNSVRLSLLLSYIIFSAINAIQAVPKGHLLGVTYEFGSIPNKLYKIDPTTGEFTLFTVLNDYKPDDATYDHIHKIFYVFGSETAARRESSMSLLLINPFNGTKQYRTIITENYAELFGLRVESSTGKLYSLQMTGPIENPVSIVQIDTINFIARRWVNITNVDDVSPDSMAILYNSTNHQYFVTVVSGINDILVGIDLIKRKIISRISNSDLPSHLCYDQKTDAFYGMQRFTDKRGCHLVRLNPYNGTVNILSDDFNDYEPSAGSCYEGYYFTMIVLNAETQKILTFDLNNYGKLIFDKLGQEYLCSLSFIPT